MKRALISVFNKESIVEFAQELDQLGWQIISSGGTYQLLKENRVNNLTKVEELTNFPEIMGGRVKTLHPKIYGGILADRSKKEHLDQAENNQIEMIDLVVCNLYPFAKTISRSNVSEEEAIENIDIGGPSMIRAAAKNYRYVYVVVDPNDYQEVFRQLKSDSKNESKESVEYRRTLAQKAFLNMSRYDEIITNYFSGGSNLDLHYQKFYDLRYGENPHQPAAFYKETKSIESGSVVNAEILHGKQLSYNNILDADAALSLINEFIEPAAAVIKHNNPCGCAVAKNINDAFSRAYQADPLSAFGGIIVLNRECTKEIAEAINKVFAEVIIAPDFPVAALTVLKQKLNIRLLKVKTPASKNIKSKEYRFIKGGILEQEENDNEVKKEELQFVTKEKPSNAEIEEMLFAWKVLKHVKSNAVILVKDKTTVGIGAGQMSRVDSVELAIKKAGDNVKGCICASDSFFPFRDSIDKLAEVGVKSIIQQGGSIKDNEVISAAEENGIKMVFTGKRAFKH